MADDSWLGNALTDPAKGKNRPPGPEERRGRKDLFPIIAQEILREDDRASKLKRGADEALGDGWIGNRCAHEPRKSCSYHIKPSLFVLHKRCMLENASWQLMSGGRWDWIINRCRIQCGAETVEFCKRPPSTRSYGTGVATGVAAFGGDGHCL
jgi:hypothetical protein